VKTDAGTAAAAHTDESKVRFARHSGVTVKSDFTGPFPGRCKSLVGIEVLHLPIEKRNSQVHLFSIHDHSKAHRHLVAIYEAQFSLEERLHPPCNRYR